MVLNKHKIYVISLFGALFLTFSGFYALLVLNTNLVGIQFSRYLTIPLRILIILFLIISLKLLGKKEKLNEPVLIAFFLFSLLYITRIVIEILQGSVYHLTNESFLFYFVALGVLPFTLIFLKKDHPVDQSVYKNAILISGSLLAIVTLVFYRDLIGTVGRINLAISREENYISPLALSYSGSMSMGIALCLMLTTPTTKLYKIYLVGVILLTSVPFFLGASRGSVLAILMPFILLIFYQRNKKKSLSLFLALIIISFLVVILSEYFGSSVIDRFVNIGADVDKGSSSAIRTVYWKIALNQYANNPIFGYKLESPETDIYPHNIFVEVLLTTGTLGIIPFIYLMIKAFQSCLAIFKNAPQLSWIAFIFLQSLIQSMFSGSIYTSSWLWFSLGALLTINLKSLYVDSNQVEHQPVKLQLS